MKEKNIFSAFVRVDMYSISIFWASPFTWTHAAQQQEPLFKLASILMKASSILYIEVEILSTLLSLHIFNRQITIQMR